MLWRGRLFDQHAVHAVLDFQVIFEWLNMNIAGTTLDRFQNEQIDKVDQRWLFSHSMHVGSFDGIDIVSRFIGRRFFIACERFCNPCGSCSIRTPHEFSESLWFHTKSCHGKFGDGSDFIGGTDIKRVKHRNNQAPTFNSNRYRANSNRDFGGQ